MDTETQKDLIRFLIKLLKETQHELNSYVVVAFMAGKNGFPVKRVLDEARASPEVQKRTDQSFEGIEELLESIGEDSRTRQFREFLENYNPKGAPN